MHLGVLLIAEVRFAVGVESPDTPVLSMNGCDTVRPYRRIFASYSHRDVAVVERVRAAALGDRYLVDVADLRAGEVWRDGPEEMVERADVFQLFWSTNSMAPAYVRVEWEYALALLAAAP